jgi:hypothetical protein
LELIIKAEPEADSLGPTKMRVESQSFTGFIGKEEFKPIFLIPFSAWFKRPV